MSKITVTVPDIGGYEGVDIIELCVKEGDVVAEGDSLIVLETDKASMEVPSTAAGKITKVLLKEGETCSEGDAVVELEVVETDPGGKGDTAQGGTKPATFTTGATVNVPLFVNIGEILKIDTRSGEYVSRAKS